MQPASPPPAPSGNLPSHLTSLFWDYDASRLAWPKDADLIIARILASGDWRSVQWLLDQCDRNALRRWIRARQGRGLDARRLRFWELVLGLPHSEVNRWIGVLERDSWPRRTG
jgi:hypothetical protein